MARRFLFFTSLILVLFSVPFVTEAQNTGSSNPSDSTTGDSITITNIITEADDDSAEIEWSTSHPGTSLVSWGNTAGSYTNFEDDRCSGSDTGLLTSHCIHIPSLSPGTTYYFEVVSLDSSNIRAEAESSFTTTNNQASNQAGSTSGSNTSGDDNEPDGTPATTSVNDDDEPDEGDSATGDDGDAATGSTGEVNDDGDGDETDSESSNPVPTLISEPQLGHISGMVRDTNGAPVTQALISAQRLTSGTAAGTSSGGLYQSLVTDAAGAYIFDNLDPGQWLVSLLVDDTTSFISTTQASEEVTVVAGGTSVVDFTVSTRDTVISGTITDANGETDETFSGFVSVTGVNNSLNSGVPVIAGAFTISVPAGTYQLMLSTAAAGTQIAGDPLTITVDGGETVDVTMVLVDRSSTISGTIIDSNREPITGRELTVIASGKNGGVQRVLVNRDTGTYTMTVSGGTWYLRVVPSSYELLDTLHQAEPVKVEIEPGQTVTQDIALKRHTATIVGVVYRDDGAPASNVWVSITSRSGRHEEVAALTHDRERDFDTGIRTNDDGKFTVTVPPGTYFVRAHTVSFEGLARPEEQKVSVGPNETADIELRFRSTDAWISGTVLWQDDPARAYITAWSENGGYIETRSSRDGRYQLTVSGNDVWHVLAKSKHNGDAYKSEVAHIHVEPGKTETKDLALKRIRTMPRSVATRINTTRHHVLSVEDGAMVEFPEAVISSANTATVSVTPDVELADQATDHVIDIGYEVSVIDENGDSVTQFNKPITITLPFNSEILAARGSRTDDLAIAYWDETTGVWRRLITSVVNETEGVVTATVNHLTRFAIVSAADITPPNAPSNVTVTQSGSAVSVSWTAPTSDFSHAKLYRSEAKNELGSMIVTDVTSGSYSDTTVVDAKTYYYTVRSVDPAGNESTNTEQFSVSVSVGSTPPNPPSSLAEAQAGMILLQVEANGEAWYVHPESLKRYYLGRPQDAFDVMRAQGLGITDSDISTFPLGLEALSGEDQDGDGLSDIFEDAIGSDKTKTDSDGDSFSDYGEISSGYSPTGVGALPSDTLLFDQLSGKILLQVERNGEAWYISPDRRKRFFLGRPNDAFTIMRNLGLGISNADLSLIAIASDSAPVL